MKTHYAKSAFVCASIFLLLVSFSFVSCEQGNPFYSYGKDLSVDGHTYYMVTQNMGNTDTTFVSFRGNKFYQNDIEDGIYTQEKEVVKVEQIKSGLLPNRVFISYGDFLLNQGVQYTKLK